MRGMAEDKTGATIPGTLSFLFTDLRQYTAFVEAHGDVAGTALIADYRRLIRAEVAKVGAGEIKTDGDAFYVVFPTARQALAAGLGILRAAQQQVRERPDRPLQIGVGIHAGEPVPHEGQYFGSAVNIAARLAQQAKPGELLVSEVVRQLLRTSAMPPMQERHGLVLKGVEDPPRVFSVVVEEVKSAAKGTAAASLSGGEVVFPAAAPADRRILCPELVGRERELATLGGLLREATAGQGRTVLLAGEAGLGKSAALRAFAERARSAGVSVLIGECTEIEARRPFGPFLEIARAALGGSDQVASADVAGLLGLVPGHGAGLGPDSLGEADRYQVHAAFAEFIGGLARKSPLLIAVEDLHWADEATLELFPYLARKLRAQPILLLGTYRSDELHRLHPLNHLLAEVARGRLAEEVRLHRLTLDETGALVRAALGLGRPLTPEFRAALQERCEGNPFFIEEVLRALVERGDLSYRDGAWRRTKDVPMLAIPLSVRDAVQQRMRLLAPDARRAIQVAALIGQRFEFELLRQVTGLSEAALLEALRAAVEAQLVDEDVTTGEERYLFRHALTRESIIAELLQRERRLLHRSIGEAMETGAGSAVEQRAEELAYHFDQARDPERALRYHEVAAREAASVFAFPRTVQHLERAVELAPDDDPALGNLQLRLAEAALHAADIPRALRAAEEAHRLFERIGDAPHSGDALCRMAMYRWAMGETRAAGELATAAVQLLEPLGDSAELAGAFGELARLAMLDQRNGEAVEYGRRAIEMAQRTGALEVRVAALNTVGTAMSRTADGGLPLLRESLDLALKHNLVWQAQRAYNNLSSALVQRGAPRAEWQRNFEETVQHARRFGLRPDQLIAAMCWEAVGRGDWDEALRLIEEGRSDTIWSAGRELVEAVILTARHGPARGLQLIDPARRRLLAAGDAQWVAMASSSAHTLLIAGDLRGVLEHAQVAAGLLESERDLPLPLTVVSAVFGATTLGDDSAADRWIRLGLAEREARNPAVRGRDAFARAERAARGGDTDAAIALLDKSAEHFSEAEFPILVHWARLRRAELFLRRDGPGDRDAAQAEFDALLPYWRKAKATWYLGKLKQWASERGLRFPD